MHLDGHTRKKNETKQNSGFVETTLEKEMKEAGKTGNEFSWLVPDGDAWRGFIGNLCSSWGEESWLLTLYVIYWLCAKLLVFFCVY